MATSRKGIGTCGVGRKKGVPNKVTREIKDLAQQYGPEIIIKLAEIAKNDSHAQQVAAGKELLDRAYGKAPQSIDQHNSGEIIIVHQFAENWRKPGGGVEVEVSELEAVEYNKDDK